jgi:hypothetical protein
MSFRHGGLRNLRNQIKVPIRPDKHGYLGRECPNPKCREYFKITPGTGITTPAPCHCPYCGHAGDSNTFFTRAQIEYAKSVAFEQITEAVHQELKSMEFDIQPSGPFGIGLSMKVKRGAPIPLLWYREKNLETAITCDQCGLRYAIYGVFGWCPNCGVHNSLQILGTNLELAKKKLALAETVDKELSGTVVADALSGIVSALDGFGRELCSDEANRVSFQSLDGARKRVLQQHGFDFADAVTEEEWRSACRGFQKRHLLAHKMGVVDEEYIKKVDDPAAVVGRKVSLPPPEVAGLVEIVARIGRRLYAGVMKTSLPGTAGPSPAVDDRSC